jgi:hypothetical protein
MPLPESQKKFSAETNIHFPGFEGLTKPTVWVFPEIVVCLDCGLAEFCIPETELRSLAQSTGSMSFRLPTFALPKMNG